MLVNQNMCCMLIIVLSCFIFVLGVVLGLLLLIEQCVCVLFYRYDDCVQMVVCLVSRQVVCSVVIVVCVLCVELMIWQFLLLMMKLGFIVYDVLMKNRFECVFVVVGELVDMCCLIQFVLIFVLVVCVYVFMWVCVFLLLLLVKGMGVMLLKKFVVVLVLLCCFLYDVVVLKYVLLYLSIIDQLWYCIVLFGICFVYVFCFGELLVFVLLWLNEYVVLSVML